MTHVSHLRLAPNSRLRWPRRSARLRLTAVCGGLFLLFSATLLGATYILFERATQYKTPRLPKIPDTPAIRHLQPPLDQAQERLALAQHELAQAVPSQVGVAAFAARPKTSWRRARRRTRRWLPWHRPSSIWHRHITSWRTFPTSWCSLRSRSRRPSTR